MQYISTRGAAPSLGFADALLTGLARDGGLYAPSTLPLWRPDAIRALRGVGYAEAAVRVMTPFIGGDFGSDELRAMTEDAYRGFRHAATAPLVQIEPNLFALELFHGPTLAFKDFAMQWLGRAMNCALGDRGKRGRPSSARLPATPARRPSRPLAASRRPTSIFSIRTAACPTSSAAR